MTKEIWINLPVKDVNKSKTFFTEIGFYLNQKHKDSDEASSLVVGNKGIIVMLFVEATFKGFTKNEIADTK